MALAQTQRQQQAGHVEHGPGPAVDIRQDRIIIHRRQHLEARQQILPARIAHHPHSGFQPGPDPAGAIGLGADLRAQTNATHILSRPGGNPRFPEPPMKMRPLRRTAGMRQEGARLLLQAL